nr:uncharacterized protein LOC105863756 isoform X3 [Microcebus murinus]
MSSPAADRSAGNRNNQKLRRERNSCRLIRISAHELEQACIGGNHLCGCHEGVETFPEELPFEGRTDRIGQRGREGRVCLPEGTTKKQSPEGSFSCQDSLTLSSQLCKEAKASSQFGIQTCWCNGRSHLFIHVPWLNSQILWWTPPGD